MKKYFVSVLTFLILSSGILISSGCKKSDNRVLARSGSIKITKDDFEKELVNSPAAYQNYLSTVEGKKQFLDILPREKILLHAAEKSGVTRKKEVQNNIKEYKERIKQQEIEFRKGIVLKEYLRELQDGELKVTEPEMKLYYDENKPDFQSPVRITASHILNNSQQDAEMALSRIKKGEDFAKVARETSTDPSAERGGLIGEVTKGDLAEIPEFENALFSLKSGQISNIIKTKLGFHIIKKNGEMRLPKQSFEEAAVKIRRTLEKKKFDQWIDKKKQEQKVWVDEQLLASIVVQPTDSSDSGASPTATP